MFNKKTSTPQTKLSHQQIMQRNPIGWIIIIVLCSIILGTKIVPKFFEWQKKSDSIKNYETFIPQIENENESLENKLTKVEQEFNAVADEYRQKEKQIFPTTIDPGKIAQILELFALQMENLDTLWQDSHFEVTKISIGKPMLIKEKRYFETSSTINFTSDEKNIYEFINFLQNQELPKEFLNGEKDGRVEPTVLQFLKDNLLPIMQIQAIRISSEQDEEDRFAVQLEIKFFSNIK